MTYVVIVHDADTYDLMAARVFRSYAAAAEYRDSLIERYMDVEDVMDMPVIHIADASKNAMRELIAVFDERKG